MTGFTLGVDISKDHLDAYRSDAGESRRFTNDRRGCAARHGSEIRAPDQ